VHPHKSSLGDMTVTEYKNKKNNVIRHRFSLIEDSFPSSREKTNFILEQLDNLNKRIEERRKKSVLFEGRKEK